MVVFDILNAVWTFFATYVLQKAPYMVGFLTLLGYCLMGKKWYDTLAGTLKAIIGMLILNAGSSGLTTTFRPILAGLKDRFNLTACVIDPYYGQNAVTAGVEEVFGKGFSQAMTLLLIAFIVNILLVRFNKLTKCRALFTTGHVQVQQAATAYWLIMFALPGLLSNNVALMIVMAVILGAYWAVGANLTIKPMQELSEGAGFAIAHQQMFGIRLSYFLSDKLFGDRGGKRKVKKVGEMEMPGFFSIFNENMVCTAILMTVFFGVIMAIIGKPFFVESGATTEAENFAYFCFHTSLNFAGDPAAWRPYLRDRIDRFLPGDRGQTASGIHPGRRLCSLFWFRGFQCSDLRFPGRSCGTDYCDPCADCDRFSDHYHLRFRSGVL